MELKKLKGREAEAYLEELAHLRIEIFRAFPYLYDGSLDYERQYLETYFSSPRSFVGVVFDGDQVVGATTAIPLQEEEEDFQKPFRENGFPLDKVVYFGESLLLPQYRGQGIGRSFFEARENYALEILPDLEWTAFCAVERAEDHPQRPPGYVDLSGMWQKMGYKKQPSMQARYRWKDIGQEQETEKALTFWLKPWGSKSTGA